MKLLCMGGPAAAQPSLQVPGKAYPGVRELAVIESLGEQGVPASICATNVDNPAGADYGYRPAMSAVVEAVKSRLPKP